MELYAGIDLHSNNSVVVVLDASDRVVYQKRLPNRREKKGRKGSSLAFCGKRQDLTPFFFAFLLLGCSFLG